MAEILLVGSIAEGGLEFEGEGELRGDVNALSLLTVDNVRSVEVTDYIDYEENISGEFIFTLNNGDTIRATGYHGIWEVLSYNTFVPEQKAKTLKELVEWLQYEIDHFDE